MKFSDRISSLKPSAIREIFKVLGDTSIISLAGGNPDPSTFPIDDMNMISDRLFATRGAECLQYSVTEGYTPLRNKVAARLKQKFNIGRDFDDTIIVTGGQQGIDLTCKILCNENDVVICEDPSFIGALNAFRSYKTRLCGIKMQRDGMDLEELENTLKAEKNAKLIYIIPTFQNPMGVTMSLEKRKALYSLAKKYGVIILEDNPYGELRFKGEDIPTLKSMDEDGIVVYCGSFSKIMSPGMRIGFVCANKEIISKIVVAKQVNDVHTNIFFQMLVDEYMQTRDIDAHISEIRDLYRRKCDCMQKNIGEYFPENVKVTDPEGGLFLWCDLPQNIDAQKFGKVILEDKVAVVPGNAFLTDENKPSSSIRLNYSMPSFEQIEIAISKLGSAIKKYK